MSPKVLKPVQRKRKFTSQAPNDPIAPGLTVSNDTEAAMNDSGAETRISEKIETENSAAIVAAGDHSGILEVGEEDQHPPSKVSSPVDRRRGQINSFEGALADKEMKGRV